MDEIHTIVLKLTDEELTILVNQKFEGDRRVSTGLTFKIASEVMQTSWLAMHPDSIKWYK